MSNEISIADLLDMELHSFLQTGGVEVMKVPGGWIYAYWSCTAEDYASPVFVSDSRFL